jgi:FAD/FMN-containing dehydrogenase
MAATPGPLELPADFKGETIRPGDAGYDAGRAVINGMIDRKPALIVRPTGAADIIDAVNLARARGLPVGVRCGAHGVAGNGVTDGGVQIDLSSLKGVRVDAENRRAWANAGVLWGEFDRETQLFGLATPGGRVTTTGVGGFTTGGGYGWLSPVYGLTCDNLMAADVVTADGRLVHTSAVENPDLLWGLRGGSSNFGIVTQFEFQLHPVGPMVLAGMLIHMLDAAPAVVRAYRDYVENAPEELVTALAVVQAPPAPFVPPELVGTPVLGIIAFYVGKPEDGAKVVAGLRAIGPPGMDLVDTMPYTAFQAMLDDFAPKGWQNYHRGVHMSALPDEAIAAFIAKGEQRLSPMTQAIMFRHGGAVTRFGPEWSAAGHRDATYMAHPIACWQDSAEDATHIAWTKDFVDALTPFATGGVYLNFEQDEGAEHVRRGYDADTWTRLVALKDKWDPTNVFRVNQNIAPSAVIQLPDQHEKAKTAQKTQNRTGDIARSAGRPQLR